MQVMEKVLQFQIYMLEQIEEINVNTISIESKQIDTRNYT